MSAGYCAAHRHFYRDGSYCRFCALDANVDAAVEAERMEPRAQSSGCPECLRETPCGCGERDRREWEANRG